MPQKFINWVGGRIQQVASIVASAGAGDADKLVSLGADGRFDPSVMPTGFGDDLLVREASETLASGDLVNYFDDGGTAKVRKADATAAGKEADGFVLDSFTSGEQATIYNEGTITGLSGLTIGARYYLSAATPGAITATPPSASGNVGQFVGRAVSATELVFEADEGVVLV